jgi:lipid-A-disaccharide synthase
MLDTSDKAISFRVAEVALHASGTVALELALSGTPMVTAYHVSSFTAWVFKRMVTSKYVNLVNILLQKPIVPELLQENCTPENLWHAVTHVLDNPDAAQAQRYALQNVQQMLLPRGASTPAYAAAQVVLGQI